MSLVRILCFVLLMLLAACASHPLDMSDDEWGALTLQQKLEAREKQAELDLKARELAVEQEKRRNEERRIARVKEREADIANGLIVEFYPAKAACIGGDKCRPRDVNEIIIPLHGLCAIDVVHIYADDRVGNRHDGVLEVMADHYRLERVDISKRSKWYQVFAGRRARNVVLKTVTDDEVQVYWVKVFGSRIDSGQIEYRVIER
ncbi:hypothetical protein [Maridesulfovibrio sp.]|uniref:hypothetical protein n=1 Tax=Maridesulfovibrio sp. TaxID=2795000 RepID=UPI0029CA1760|nr:hypothetical protein [Maridesulfovibrio sp.]